MLSLAPERVFLSAVPRQPVRACDNPFQGRQFGCQAGQWIFPRCAGQWIFSPVPFMHWSIALDCATDFKLVLAEGTAVKVLLAVTCSMLLTVAVVQVSKDQASTGISVAQLGKGKGKGKAPVPPPIVAKG
jgi:hypothetical protein